MVYWRDAFLCPAVSNQLAAFCEVFASPGILFFSQYCAIGTNKLIPPLNFYIFGGEIHVCGPRSALRFRHFNVLCFSLNVSKFRFARLCCGVGELIAKAQMFCMRSKVRQVESRARAVIIILHIQSFYFDGVLIVVVQTMAGWGESWQWKHRSQGVGRSARIRLKS